MDSAEYIEQLRKKYTSFLKRKVGGYPFEPIALKKVRNIPADHQQFITQTAVFNKFNKETTGKGWTIEWRKTKRLGRQKWPTSITVDTEDDYLFLIGKKAATEKLFKRFDQLIQWKPELRSFFEAHPTYIETYEPLWDELIGTINYLLQHDVQGKLIREISIPADTKFLEKNERILLRLLKFLAPERGDPKAQTLKEYLELGAFPHIRSMRWLDPLLAEKYTGNVRDFALNLHEWGNLHWEIDEIWLVENLTSLYILPYRKNALAIFSKGFDLHRLKEIQSLQNARLYYWGDLDEHGFILLSQMREHYPEVQSVLMDIHTLEQHIQMLQTVPFEKKQLPRRLTNPEQDTYDFLEERNGRIEQERIRYDCLLQYINHLPS
jgi:hypothetical protein